MHADRPSRRRAAPTVALVASALLAGCQDYTIAPTHPDVDPNDVTDCGFTPIPGTRLSRYACNPVFSDADLKGKGRLGATTFHVQEVMAHPFYQMWYVRHLAGGTPYQLDYAVSPDGVAWTDHPDNPAILDPTPGDWDRDDMQGIKVVWDPAGQRYVLLYLGVKQAIDGDTRIGAYESADGVAWSPTGRRALLDTGTVQKGLRFCWPLALDRPSDDVWAGFLAGGPGTASNTCQIYRFSTPRIEDASTFAVDPTPVLEAGPEAYDRQGMVDAAIARLDGTFYLFYVGFNRWTEQAGTNLITATDTSLALATSTDGVHWTKDPANPIAEITATRDGQVSAVAAQVVGRRIHLWITDYYGRDADGKVLNDQAIGYFYYEPDIEPHPADAAAE